MGASLSFPFVSLSGRVAVVTGGNTGIGYETAKALAVMGAHTIIACRSSERAISAVERLKEEIVADFPGKTAVVEWMLLDLSSFRSTKDFTVAFREKNLPLHLLINNAGIAWLPQSMTEDGYEAHFQVNHLGHFLLTLELLPLMLDSAHSSGDGRIVFVSSRLHANGQFTPENLNGQLSYSRTAFYYHSKLYNVMTAFAVQRRLRESGITVSSLHPGRVETDLGRNLADSKLLGFLYKTYTATLKRTCRDAKAGAITTINCAVNPELNSQQCFYYDSCQVKEPSAVSRNQQLQEQLWEISINIVKDYLTPEVLEKYGAHERPQDGNEAETHQTISNLQGAVTTSGRL